VESRPEAEFDTHASPRGIGRDFCGLSSVAATRRIEGKCVTQAEGEQKEGCPAIREQGNMCQEPIVPLSYDLVPDTFYPFLLSLVSSTRMLPGRATP
jgi:hypothetical protein